MTFLSDILSISDTSALLTLLILCLAYCAGWLAGAAAQNKEEQYLQELEAQAGAEEYWEDLTRSPLNLPQKGNPQS